MKIHDELAAREFPDLQYQDYLRARHDSGKVGAYLEVGVRWGDALKLARPGCKAVGVDPAFDIKVPLPSAPELYAQLSDDFFFEHTERYTGFFDLIFLDGLHEARQTAKDIYHALSVLKPGGEILVHDVLPISLAITTPSQKTRFWTGNVWQAAYAFCDRDMPLKWEFVDAAPSGLFRLYDIDPAFRPSRARIMQRVAEAGAMTFADAPALLGFLRGL
nr:class I SAM-dependent methyltransferase [Kordiimonas marina]